MKEKHPQIYFNKCSFDLELIIKQYSNYVYSIIYKISKNSLTLEDNEEILSEVFFKLWVNRKKIKQFKTITPYLGVITRNLTIDYLRKRKIVYEYNDEVLLGKNTDDFNNIELLEDFEKCIQNLSETDKEIITRAILKDENTTKIACSMGIKKSTIEVKIHRAKKKIAKSLMEMGYLYESK